MPIPSSCNNFVAPCASGTRHTQCRLLTAHHLPACGQGEAFCARELRDAPRSFDRLAVEPRHQWLAATDNLGRVALLEARSLVIVSLWKGYRDAQVESMSASSCPIATRIPHPIRTQHPAHCNQLRRDVHP